MERACQDDPNYAEYCPAVQVKKVETVLFSLCLYIYVLSIVSMVCVDALRTELHGSRML